MRGTTIIFVALLLIGCGSDGSGEPDATDVANDTPADVAVDTTTDTATDTPTETECMVDEDCNDGNNCTADVCNTDYGTCSHDAVDADDDGYPAMEVDGMECAGGTDCDDSDEDIHPDAELDCTGEVDMDCDGLEDTDEDEDGYETTECGGDDCDDADALAFPGSTELDCNLDRDCNEHMDSDNDGDGYDSLVCGGDDCDDASDGVNPGESELVCNGIDDDCNGEMSSDEDADHDGFANEACAAEGSAVDCDDTDDTIFPGASEVACNGIDDDCDGALAAEEDADGDGYPNASCAMGEIPVDCDDDVATTYPGATEVCDLVDDDCDGSWADGGADDDGDGYLDDACGGDDCDDTRADTYAGASEGCDGTWDNDCDGDASELETDADGDGHAPASCGGDDCDDSNPDVHPSAPLVCDMVDNDCSGDWADEAGSDDDADGYLDALCGGDDCDDTLFSVHPGAAELCDTIDQDCDGRWSDGGADDDLDGYLDALCGGHDCDDTLFSVHPGAAELCDTIDQDCDGRWSDGGADDDHDGYLDALCGGDDCDDTRNDVYPGAELTCSNEDRDCSGAPDNDEDYDGYVSEELCPHFGDDCDDFDADTYTGAPELCTDGIDQDCDTVEDCHDHEECGTSGECETAFETIDPGTFLMGSLWSEPGRVDDETWHEVTLTGSFEIMAAEVTQGQFETLMGYNPSYFTYCGSDCPVEQVNWHEAAAYANALSTDAGYAECYDCTGSGTGVTCEPSSTYATPYDCPGYRLPTEAEWEYAARAGTTGGTYNGTSTLTRCESPNTVLDSIAWFCGNSSSTIHEVGTRDPNAWGLFDMLGNVQEWCHDWYGTYPGTVTDPWGPVTGASRVTRGGSFGTMASYVRAASRSLFQHPGNRYPTIGLRLARSLP